MCYVPGTGNRKVVHGGLSQMDPSVQTGYSGKACTQGAGSPLGMIREASSKR